MNDRDDRWPDWDGDPSATVPLRDLLASVAFERALAARAAAPGDARATAAATARKDARKDTTPLFAREA